MTALHELGVVELLDGFRDRRFGPMDVLDACLDRIDRGQTSARWSPSTSIGLVATRASPSNDGNAARHGRSRVCRSA